MGSGTNKYIGVFTRKLKSGERLNITFNYQGERCREALPGLNPELKGDWDFAFGLKKEIERMILLGKFDYANYFPNSPKAKKFAAKSTATVNDYLMEYISNSKKRGLSVSTIEGYEKAKNAFKSIHHIKVVDLTPSDIKRYIKDSNVTLKTMRNRLSVLNSALNEAVVDGVLPLNPCTSVKPHQYMNKVEKVSARGEHDDVDPFRPKEIAAILNACRNELERNLLTVMFYTGMRPSEAAALQWIDVDLVNEELKVCEAVIWDSTNKKSVTKGTKTKSGNRIIELQRPALESLLAQQQYTGDNKFVFIEPRQKKQLTGAAQIRKNIWIPVLNKSNVRYRHPYQARHTFATMLISDGRNLWWIADQMGHDGPEMLFRHYGSYIKEHDLKLKQKSRT
ncbi:site-specific integrase [Pseudoalteromonas sp. JC28]|uniref:tyrosine-type recombinase/integrase n=1 Tax=Pseudoalteromonas sp. JC28 TaxID=2267617 RepID=UPI001573C937|nr:site-specific integrase [Pseudoalteromonas sp. JC28]